MNMDHQRIKVDLLLMWENFWEKLWFLLLWMNEKSCLLFWFAQLGRNLEFQRFLEIRSGFKECHPVGCDLEVFLPPSGCEFEVSHPVGCDHEVFYPRRGVVWGKPPSWAWFWGLFPSWGVIMSFLTQLGRTYEFFDPVGV